MMMGDPCLLLMMLMQCHRKIVTGPDVLVYEQAYISIH